MNKNLNLTENSPCLAVGCAAAFAAVISGGPCLELLSPTSSSPFLTAEIEDPTTVATCVCNEIDEENSQVGLQETEAEFLSKLRKNWKSKESVSSIEEGDAVLTKRGSKDSNSSFASKNSKQAKTKFRLFRRKPKANTTKWFVDNAAESRKNTSVVTTSEKGEKVQVDSLEEPQQDNNDDESVYMDMTGVKKQSSKEEDDIYVLPDNFRKQPANMNEAEETGKEPMYMNLAEATGKEPMYMNLAEATGKEAPVLRPKSNSSNNQDAGGRPKHWTGKYAELDLGEETDPKPFRNRNPRPNTDYAEIDFVATKALKDVKKAQNERYR